MKFCTNCGAQCEDDVKFCQQCGTAFENEQAAQFESQPEPQSEPQPTAQEGNYTYNQNVYANNIVYQSGPSHNIQPRNIAVAIILAIVTCGIYNIYWMIKLNDEINCLANDPTATSGGMVFLLTLVTCGIYGYFWFYKMGEKCDRIKGVTGSTGILYLVLGIFGVGIVNYCLMQDTINKAL